MIHWPSGVHRIFYLSSSSFNNVQHHQIVTVIGVGSFSTNLTNCQVCEVSQAQRQWPRYLFLVVTSRISPPPPPPGLHLIKGDDDFCEKGNETISTAGVVLVKSLKTIAREVTTASFNPRGCQQSWKGCLNSSCVQNSIQQDVAELGQGWILPTCHIQIPSLLPPSFHTPLLSIEKVYLVTAVKSPCENGRHCNCWISPLCKPCRRMVGKKPKSLCYPASLYRLLTLMVQMIKYNATGFLGLGIKRKGQQLLIRMPIHGSKR